MNAQPTAIQNLALLSQHHPDASKGLLTFLRGQRLKQKPSRFQLIQTPNQTANLIDLRYKDTPALHDLHSPAQEAEEHTREIRESPRGVIFVVSAGLGYVPLALAPLCQNSKIVIIEPEWEILFLALKALDWRELLQTSNVLLLCGENANQDAKQLVHKYGSLLKRGADVIKGRMLHENENAFVDELKNDIIESKKTFQRHYTTPRAVTKNKAVFAAAQAHKELLPTLKKEATAFGLQNSGTYRRYAIKNFLHTEEMWWETLGLPLPHAVLSFSHAMFFPQEWSQMAKHGVHRIVWYYDDPFRNPLKSNCFNCIDQLFCFDPELAGRLQALYVHQVNYLPAATTFSQGVPKKCFKNFTTPPEICFVGSTGIQRIGEGNISLITQDHPSFRAMQELAESHLKQGQSVPYHELSHLDVSLPVKKREARICLLEDLTTLAVRLHYLSALEDMNLSIFGDQGWAMKEVAGGLTQFYQGRDLQYLHETPWIYQVSAINVNIFNVQCVNSPTVRVLDVMACGGFLLTEYRPFLEEMFKIGEELDVFRTQEELQDKAKYYLAHPDQREQIANAGQKRVLSEHRYRNRMSVLFQHILDQ